jgi:hypothetical protein
MDWVQVRFELNRSTVPASYIERIERKEWCRITGYSYIPTKEPPISNERKLHKNNEDKVLVENALAKPTNSTELNRSRLGLMKGI